MILEELAKPAASAFSGRFFLVSTLPTTAATVCLLLLLWAGAPGPVRWQRAWHTAAQLKTGEALLLLLAISLIGLVTMPLQLPLIRWLEGYWPRWLAWLSARCRAWQLRRRGPTDYVSSLKQLRRQAPISGAITAEATTAENQQLGERGEWQRSHFPVRDHLIRPTGLGNALTAAEARAGRAYGLDAVAAWPRLEPLLSEQMRTTVSDRRTAMDAAARLSVTAAGCVPLTVWLLWRSGWWLLLAALLAAVAWLAYVGTVHAAIAYGECVTAAFDLHRFDLLTALHLPLPADPAEEFATNQALSLLWRQGVRAGIPRYQHPPSDGPAPQPPLTETTGDD